MATEVVGGGADPVLMTCVCPYDIAVHAPDSGGILPVSQTPGDPATPSPRRRTLRHRGLPKTPLHSALTVNKGLQRTRVPRK